MTTPYMFFHLAKDNSDMRRRLLVILLFICSISSFAGNNSFSTTVEKVLEKWNTLLGLWYYQEADTIILINIDKCALSKAYLYFEGSYAIIVNNDVYKSLDYGCIPKKEICVKILRYQFHSNIAQITLNAYAHYKSQKGCERIQFKILNGEMEYIDNTHMCIDFSQTIINGHTETYFNENPLPIHMYLRKLKKAQNIQINNYDY